MDSCCLSHSSSNSSFETNHSSWSFVGEDDFDLLDDDRGDSASENKMNDGEEKDEELEKEDCDDESEDNVDNANNEINDDGDYMGNDYNDDEDDGAGDADDDNDDNDDDISLVTEEDVLNDLNARAYVDVVKVSKQLDKLSKCFDSPFTHVFESFTSERNVRLMAVISTAAVAVIIFYSAFAAKPTMPLTSTESVCLAGEERLLGLQYRDTASYFLCEFFKNLFKSSIGFWSVLLPATTVSLTTTNEPNSWIFNSGSIITSSQEDGHFSTNQCERVPDENQFSAVNEAVQRYLKYTKKTRRCESPSLPDTNETLGDADDAEPHHDRKLQVDLEVIMTDDSQNWNSLKIESSEHSESTKLKISKSRKAVSLSKPTLPIPLFSAKHFSIEPKTDLRTLVPTTELVLNMPLRRELTSATEEKQYSEVLSNIKNVKLMEKKEKKQQYDVDLSSLLRDSKLRISEKVLESGSGRSAHQPKKAKKIISSVKKAISRTVERAKAHRDKFLEQFRKAIDSLAPKNQPKAFQADMKAAAAKERCVLNSTCNVLASLARTLAGISLFPAIVGQANAAKYINSLLDLSTCTGLRLVCETCWWTRECCPKERCTFLPWQRHFNTKRFLISQSHVMSEVFAKLGWSMPKKKGRGDGGKLKLKLDHLSCSTNLRKEMCCRQSKKRSMGCYSRKGGVQNHIH